MKSNQSEMKMHKGVGKNIKIRANWKLHKDLM